MGLSWRSAPDYVGLLLLLYYDTTINPGLRSDVCARMHICLLVAHYITCVMFIVQEQRVATLIQCEGLGLPYDMTRMYTNPNGSENTHELLPLSLGRQFRSSRGNRLRL